VTPTATPTVTHTPTQSPTATSTVTMPVATTPAGTTSAGTTPAPQASATATPGSETTRDPNLSPDTGGSLQDTLGLLIVLGLAVLLVGTGIVEARRRL
jgi:hypothetical protein